MKIVIIIACAGGGSSATSERNDFNQDTPMVTKGSRKRARADKTTEDAREEAVRLVAPHEAAAPSTPAKSPPGPSLTSSKVLKAEEKTPTGAPAKVPKKSKTSQASTPVKSIKDSGALTSEEEAAYERFRQLKIPQLKELLRHNCQLVGGTKGELVDRCVDRVTRGNMPRCPECGGGVLKYGKGGYFCPGFYDDDHFAHCNFKALGVERPKWVDPADTQ